MVQVNGVVLEENQLPEKFQLRPVYQKKFKQVPVQQVIRNYLQEKLLGMEYNAELCASSTKDISNEIRDLMSQTMGYDRYKFIVSVVIGEQRGQGVKFSCRCFWDEDTDGHATEVYMNVWNLKFFLHCPTHCCRTPSIVL